MLRHNVRTPEQALAYITDCTLATVVEMAMRKKKSKSEFSRQIAIAQTAIDWMKQMGVDFSTTRAAEIGGTVKDWAEKIEKGR